MKKYTLALSIGHEIPFQKAVRISSHPCNVGTMTNCWSCTIGCQKRAQRHSWAWRMNFVERIDSTLFTSTFQRIATSWRSRIRRDFCETLRIGLNGNRRFIMDTWHLSTFQGKVFLVDPGFGRPGLRAWRELYGPGWFQILTSHTWARVSEGKMLEDRAENHEEENFLSVGTSLCLIGVYVLAVGR